MVGVFKSLLSLKKDGLMGVVGMVIHICTCKFAYFIFDYTIGLFYDCNLGGFTLGLADVEFLHIVENYQGLFANIKPLKLTMFFIF